MKCRYCSSENIRPSKWIQWGPKTGNTYHYRVKCLDCHKSYGVEREHDMFKLVEKLPWLMTKKTRLHIAKYNQTKLI